MSGSRSTARLRPAPGRRTRSDGPAPPDNSTAPTINVFRLISAAAATLACPPRPNASTIAAAINRRCRSSNNGNDTEKNLDRPSSLSSTPPGYNARLKEARTLIAARDVLAERGPPKRVMLALGGPSSFQRLSRTRGGRPRRGAHTVSLEAELSFACCPLQLPISAACTSWVSDPKTLDNTRLDELPRVLVTGEVMIGACQELECARS